MPKNLEETITKTVTDYLLKQTVQHEGKSWKFSYENGELVTKSDQEPNTLYKVTINVD